ncbi:MAG TPA: hypothetical protein VMZ91_07820 [Candidatus Paceibacterota bacterium]|nr:hypothetical protein [Candidatus Paceibacterota bacterium]
MTVNGVSFEELSLRAKINDKLNRFAKQNSDGYYSEFGIYCYGESISEKTQEEMKNLVRFLLLEKEVQEK